MGTTSEIRKLAGPGTRVIDLGGGTVVPGLIDSHMHAIRAGLSFATEVNWVGAHSLVEALGRIREGAQTRRPGSWLIVAGGWNVDQFQEKRRPTQAELTAAAPGNPVYVQLGYGWAVMTPAGFEALHITSDADLPPHGKLERDASGKPTGAVSGGQDAIIALFDRLPKPTLTEQVQGTKLFFRELNRLGLTGVVDPGGNNLAPEDYQALLQVWREHQMTVRVAYSLCGQTPGGEFKELMDRMIEKIHAAGTVGGAPAMKYPGERENLIYQERSVTGIPLHHKIVSDLQQMSVELNLPLDQIWEE